MILQGQLLFDASAPPEPGWLAIKGDRIAEIGRGRPPAIPAAGGSDCLICPGFIDAHLHLPQIDAIGCEKPDLMSWLREVVYPAEARWSDARFAAAQIGAAYERLLAAGTLGFAGFLSPHARGVGFALHQTRQTPLRSIVGQALMDRGAPQALINEPPEPVRSLPGGRLSVSVNPRFAVACSDHLLDTARDLAGDLTTIQTHLAESAEECKLVRSLFPADASYAAVYDRHGLLTPRTLLAHGVHLNDDEWRLIAARGSVVVHCPSANLFLRSGLFDLEAAQRHGVRMGLGSDIAAGCDLAMPRIARAMIEVAKLRAMTIEPRAAIPTPADVWHLITRGNADALGWPDAGRMEVGAAADLLILHPEVEYDQHLCGRLIYGWREEWISDRIVAGQLMPRPRPR